MAFLLEAISRNAHKISLTILLCLVVLYTFATVTYMAFRNQYGFNDASDCTTLITCFKLHVDYGLSNSPSWQGDGAIQPAAPAIFRKANQEVGEEERNTRDHSSTLACYFRPDP